MVTLRTTALTLARRLTLVEPPAGWSVLLAESEHPRYEAKLLADALQALGKGSVIRPLGADFSRVCLAVDARTETLLILLADDSFTEDLWRELDLRRSWLECLSPAILLLSPRSAETVHRAASHLVSWLGGAFHRLDVRSEVESLVAEGRIGDARRLARGYCSESLGPVAKELGFPTVSTKPASGSRDLSEAARWLRENWQAFEGRWVALLSGKLVDSDPSRKVLQERLAQNDHRRDVLVLRVG